MSRLTTLALGAAVLCGFHSGSTLAEKNLFGTLHGHSNWSIDAFGVGNTSLGPEKAYEFARGERVTHLNGAEVQLSQPLDFFMLSDHAEMMGTAPGFIVEGSPTYDTEIARLTRAGKATERPHTCHTEVQRFPPRTVHPAQPRCRRPRTVAGHALQCHEFRAETSARNSWLKKFKG